MSRLVTHFLGGQRGGKMEDLILQVLEAANENPVGILARDAHNASEIGQRVRSRSPDVDVDVQGTYVSIRVRSRRR